MTTTAHSIKHTEDFRRDRSKRNNAILYDIDIFICSIKQRYGSLDFGTFMQVMLCDKNRQIKYHADTESKRNIVKNMLTLNSFKATELAKKSNCSYTYATRAIAAFVDLKLLEASKNKSGFGGARTYKLCEDAVSYISFM